MKAIIHRMNAVAIAIILIVIALCVPFAKPAHAAAACQHENGVQTGEPYTKYIISSSKHQKTLRKHVICPCGDPNASIELLRFQEEAHSYSHKDKHNGKLHDFWKECICTRVEPGSSYFKTCNGPPCSIVASIKPESI